MSFMPLTLLLLLLLVLMLVQTAAEALHVVALPGARQQDIRRQAAVVAHPALLQPSCSTLALGRHDDRAQRHCFGRVLSTPVIPDWQAKGGDRHGTDKPADRRRQQIRAKAARIEATAIKAAPISTAITTVMSRIRLLR